MKNNADAVKDQAPKTSAPKAPKAKRLTAPKVEKAAPKDEEPADRLPTTVEELKASKGGLVTFLFLSCQDKAEIAKELKAACKLSEEQAVKIVRRITGRSRFFQRAFSLVTAK
jgi:hypothetical protein